MSADNVTSPGLDKFISYDIEIDEKLSAFILKNKSASKRFWLYNLPIFHNKKTKTFIWINNPQYRFDLVPIEAYNKLFLENIPILISSCSEKLVPFFTKNKFESIKVGKEAILNLKENPFKKSSLKELIKAGSKKGSIEEIPYSLENSLRLEKFKSECVHGHEPQLKYFFNDKFLPSSRLFIFKDNKNNWEGGILISIKDNEKIFTDLILRKENSPRGTMEALIHFIFIKLQMEGYKSWSLGEVPYVVYGSKLFSKEFLINFIGRKFRFAYNYIGLYNFKNKFSPEWENIYLCCKPGLSFQTILKISWRSNWIKLIFKKSLPKLF
ncbi:MAG: phosphatidylglycerol lysyltransferase domain-containing protein [Bacteroidetes bacterium]|nr:phosphatidylglycerol lysyltransferase domain-containing protein [Bacteroidota bacterium]